VPEAGGAGTGGGRLTGVTSRSLQLARNLDVIETCPGGHRLLTSLNLHLLIILTNPCRPASAAALDGAFPADRLSKWMLE
jgi:hypothetical protein